MRTSITHPIRVDWVSPGLGCTFAPGKRGDSLNGADWQRDLVADLARLRAEFQVDVLISLIEDFELSLLGIPDLVEQASAHDIAIIRSPIPDGGTPSLDQAQSLVSTALQALANGQRVVFHCRGGLGRAGTLAACVLRARGLDGETAMAQTRSSRVGAIENRRQEAFVLGFEPA